MEKQTHADFSLGAWEHDYTEMLQPRGSVKQLLEGYVDDSGIVRCRGKVSQRVATVLTNPGSFVWAGDLLPGFREMYCDYDSATQFGVVRVLDAAGTAVAASEAARRTEATSYTVIGNMLLVGRSLSAPASPTMLVYGGSRKATYVAPGNTQFTAGSAIVTNAGALFLANVDVGMIVPGGGAPGGLAVVKSVDSNTQITMDRPSNATIAVGGFSFLFSGNQYPPSVLLGATGEYVLGAVAGRLLILQGNRLNFSLGPDPATGGPRTGEFAAGDLHEFPSDAVGVAVAALRDKAVCFTRAGVFVVSNMAYNIVDGSGNAQHPIELLSSQLIALGQRGIVPWGNALVVPCRDGIYALDGIGAPVKISRGVPFAELVRDGLELGWATVYKGRYILPYLYGGQRRVWAYRLDGKDSEQGLMFPVSTFATLPTGVRAVAKSGPDSLLAVGDAAHGLQEMGDVFTTVTDGLDWDASTAGGGFTLTTAPFALGDKAVVRRVRVRYSFVVGTATVAPTLNASVSGARDGTTLGSFASATMLAASPPSVPGTRWVALDLPAPLEADVVTVTLSLTNADPKDFIVQAVEVQFRRFGGA